MMGRQLGLAGAFRPDWKFDHDGSSVPRFTGKTQITGNTAKIQERPKNNRELNYAIH